MPVNTTAIAAGVGAAATVAGTAIEASQGGMPRVKLPPEMEAQQLEIIQESIDQAQLEAEKTGAISQSLFERGQTLMDVEQGLIPEKEALQKITQQNQIMAERFGDEILDQIGELSKDLDFESKLRDYGVDMLGKPLEEFKDPTVEREISEGRIALEEQLTKQLGPGWQNTESGIRALRAFEQSSTEMRSDASREIRAEEMGVYNTLLGAGQSIVGTRTGAGSQMFQGRQAAYGNLLAGMNSNAGANMFATGTNITGERMQYGNIPFSQMQQFGSQDLSGDIKGAIEGGQFMPEFQTYGEYKHRNPEQYGAMNEWKGSSKDEYYGRW